MDFLEVVMVFYQVFLLSHLQCTIKKTVETVRGECE
jgi:hypothetical protein